MMLELEGCLQQEVAFPRPSCFSADASSCIRTDLAKPAGGTFRRQHAPRCDVTASQLDATGAGPTSPVFFFAGEKDGHGFARIPTD